AVLAMNGYSADGISLVKRLGQRMEWYKHAHDKEMSTPALAQMLSNTLYYRRFFPYYTFSLLGGLDEKGQGVVYSFDPVGSYKAELYKCGGSASRLIQPFLDSQVGFKNQQNVEKHFLPLEQVIRLARDAFTSATERDIYTGDLLEIFIIKQDGITEAIDQGKIKFIQFDTFSNIQIIASGAFGEVSRAYWSIGEKNVSLKSLGNEYSNCDQRFYQEFIKEVDIIEGYRESPVIGTPNAFAEIYSKAWCSYEEQRPTIQQACDALDEINLLPTFDSHPSPSSLFSYESSTSNVENTMAPRIIQNKRTTMIPVEGNVGSTTTSKNVWPATVDISSITSMAAGADNNSVPATNTVRRRSGPVNDNKSSRTASVDRGTRATNAERIADKRTEDRRLLMSQKLQKPKTKDAQRQRAAYPISKKEEVVEYAKKYSRNAAARHYGLDAPMVGRWVKASEKWNKDTNKNIMRLGSGRRAFFPEAEDRLHQWILEQRNAGTSMSYAIIRKQMLEILKEPDMVSLYSNAGQFKARSRWLTAFMKRKKIALKRRNKLPQKLSEQLRISLDKFRHDIFQLRCALPFEMHNILNMCETPVWFDMSGHFAVNPIGEKSNYGNRSNNDKSRFTMAPNTPLYAFSKEDNCAVKSSHMVSLYGSRRMNG
ncbi:12426_t:CDS:2, partial [Acaulospora colombiana]